MSSVSFFLGRPPFRFWYILFYILSLPVYGFGLYLLLPVHGATTVQTREFMLTIFSFGYLLLALGSLINSIWYMKLTKKVFRTLFIFLGVQVIFWMIGNFLGNNYTLLFMLFLTFFCVAIYLNLFLLQKIQNHHHVGKNKE